MITTRPFVERDGTVLRADPSRVLARLFLPGQEMLMSGISRADAVVRRVLAMSEPDVVATLADTVERFAERHQDLSATFAEHYAQVAHRVPAGQFSQARQALIGAYFTQEYSVEAAALFNPSMVAHPDQTRLAEGELRVLMSVRAVGEGHVSSIEFRTGVLDGANGVRLDEPARHLVTGHAEPARLSRSFLRAAVSERSDARLAEHVLSLLPESFEPAELDVALRSVRRDKLTRASTDSIIERVRWLASCNYQLRFPPEHPLSGRVVFPYSADESHGIEDARFTRFEAADGEISYLATYTAFDGSSVAPRMLSTRDFTTFEMTQLIGPGAKNKGMALFPRQVGGRYFALSRWDRESIGITSSLDGRVWSDAETVQSPGLPWDLIQLGNCGPPLETPDGWLVLTHGVGPMRSYGIGAILLDLDDPMMLIGAVTDPILTPDSSERDGYVPNVVYSCGALVHGNDLVLPYGCSDSAIRFGVVDLAALLAVLRPA